jgi:P27 family predicted phage terminase small subunit
MTRGPSPTPKDVLQLRGSWRAEHRGDAPSPPVCIPPPPECVTANPVALCEWKRVTLLLEQMGTLALVDMSAVAGYAVAFARWHEAELAVQSQGAIVRDAKGNPIQNPWLAVSNRAARDMKAFGEQLGLSPASRARITVNPPAPPQGVMKRQRG